MTEPEQVQALRAAFATHLKSAVLLLYAWRNTLPDERLNELRQFESQGLRVGISLAMPADSWVATVTLTDAAGASMRLDTIALDLRGGASLGVN